MSYFGTNKIGKMHLGSTAIGKAYIGSNLVYQSSGGTGPQPETTIPYIRGGGSGGSYIDTGITADNNTRVIVWARNFNPNATVLFGSRLGGTNATYGVFALGLQNSGSLRYDFGSAQYVISDAFSKMSGYHKYELDGPRFLVDDVLLGTATSATFSNGVNIYLYAINTNGRADMSSLPIDICACQIYKNDVLVRDFTAVNTPSVGLFDAESQTIFTNAGTGNFTYGEFNKDAYTPLEYIEDDFGSYYDSGVKAGYATQIISKFRFTKNTQNVTLLGYRGNSDWCEFDINYGSTVKMFYRLANASAWSALFNGAANNFVDNDIVLVKGTTNSAELYKNSQKIGNTVSPSSSTSYVSTGNIYIGALNLGGAAAQKFSGLIYYIGIGSYRSFVPAKNGSKVGMYDTYNDVFYPSATDTPFIAGPAIKRTPTHYFRWKNLSIIGDSISTYNADGYKYDNYSMYYPYGEVDSVEETYWKMLMNDENATLEVNLSYSGSCACSRSGYVSLNDRIGLIGNADTVIIALGTNDSAQSKPLGDYLYDTPYSELGEANFREAYIKGIKGLLAANPDIDIVCAILSMDRDYRASIKEIAQHYGLKCIDCGNGYAKVQGVHPNVAGMKEIENHFLYD